MLLRSHWALLGGAVVWCICVSPGMSPTCPSCPHNCPCVAVGLPVPPSCVSLRRSGVPRDVPVSPTGAHVSLGMSPEVYPVCLGVPGVSPMGVSLPSLCHRGYLPRCPCPPASPHGCSLCFLCDPRVSPHPPHGLFPLDVPTAVPMSFTDVPTDVPASSYCVPVCPSCPHRCPCVPPTMYLCPPHEWVSPHCCPCVSPQCP